MRRGKKTRYRIIIALLLLVIVAMIAPASFGTYVYLKRQEVMATLDEPFTKPPAPTSSIELPQVPTEDQVTVREDVVIGKNFLKALAVALKYCKAKHYKELVVTYGPQADGAPAPFMEFYLWYRPGDYSWSPVDSEGNKLDKDGGIIRVRAYQLFGRHVNAPPPSTILAIK